MTDSPDDRNHADIPRSELIQQIRKQFGVTQAKLATAMGVSAKAIQSYEQGWRRVPSRVLVQLLVLLAIHRRRQVDMAPCWEIADCPSEKRKDCPCFSIGDGQFCWFVSAGGERCHAPAAQRASDDALLPCMGCEVIRRLLRESPAAASSAETKAPPGQPGDIGGAG